MELIDKSKLLEELKRCEKICENYISSHQDAVSQGIANAKRAVCQHFIKFLDTLEVKEVDLEQEIQQHINECLDIKFPTTDIKLIAKDVEYTARKFFELGLKAQKGE